MKLHGLVPNSYSHVLVSDIYISTISLPILLHENRWADLGNTYINRSQIHITYMWKLGLRPRSFFLGNTKIGFSLRTIRTIIYPTGDRVKKH